jgi:hypothetical protein
MVSAHRECLRQNDNRVKGLILGAEGDILPSQSSQKPFQFLLAWQMKWKPFEAFAISPEPGGSTALRGQRKLLRPSQLRKSVHPFTRIFHNGTKKVAVSSSERL